MDSRRKDTVWEHLGPMESSAPQNPYEEAATEYAAHNESNVWNAGYERPAILALLPEVSGQRVLDAGCGSGAHAAELRSRGASVIGVDNSAALLEIARRRLGPDMRLHLADLGDPCRYRTRPSTSCWPAW